MSKRWRRTASFRWPLEEVRVGPGPERRQIPLPDHWLEGPNSQCCSGLRRSRPHHRRGPRGRGASPRTSCSQRKDAAVATYEKISSVIGRRHNPHDIVYVNTELRQRTFVRRASEGEDATIGADQVVPVIVGGRCNPHDVVDMDAQSRQRAIEATVKDEDASVGAYEVIAVRLSGAVRSNRSFNRSRRRTALHAEREESCHKTHPLLNTVTFVAVAAGGSYGKALT